MKQELTNKYWMTFCSEAGQVDVQYLNSVQQQKVQDDESNDECEWGKLLEENKIDLQGATKWNWIISTSSDGYWWPWSYVGV